MGWQRQSHLTSIVVVQLPLLLRGAIAWLRSALFPRNITVVQTPQKICGGCSLACAMVEPMPPRCFPFGCSKNSAAPGQPLAYSYTNEQRCIAC
mmetsp:Transcript_9312/g.23168  ORF Transcript_9312/g.23168 Transcript_9312/m.23168 type:complete len:94 (+) Transcript_9312:954-1235(+)